MHWGFLRRLVQLLPVLVQMADSMFHFSAKTAISAQRPFTGPEARR